MEILHKLKQFFFFGLVGGFGTLLNTAILYLLSTRWGMNYLIASAIATETAIISNFFGNNYLTFKSKDPGQKMGKKFLSFQLISLVSLVGTVFFLWVFVSLFGKDLLLLWNLFAIIIMFVINFLLNSRFTWREADDASRRQKTLPRGETRVDGPAMKMQFLFIICIGAIFLLSPFPGEAQESGNDSEALNSASLIVTGEEADEDLDQDLIVPNPVNDSNALAVEPLDAGIEGEAPDQLNDQQDGNDTVSMTVSRTDGDKDKKDRRDKDDDREKDDETDNEDDTENDDENEDETDNKPVNPPVDGAAVTDDSTDNLSDSVSDTPNRTVEESTSEVDVVPEAASENVTLPAMDDAIEDTVLDGSGILDAPMPLAIEEEQLPIQAAQAGSIVAISQLGYHPSSKKTVIVYTDSQSGTFTVRDSKTDAIQASYSLSRPEDYAGNPVNCQGNMPCLTGDFTDFSLQGDFYIDAGGPVSPSFPISNDVFSKNIPLLFEFFNAQLQQGSAYHADMHTGIQPPFNVMSDGSFIMEADQAALSLIRLGSAYRSDPQAFQFDRYDILSAAKPDAQEYILSYVMFLEGLQGVSVVESDAPGAVRLGSGMVIEHVFVPGPTDLETMKVFIPTDPPTLLQTAPVVSLCGADDGSNAWDECIADAASFYSCQIDEPCLNISYNDRKGIVTTDPDKNGYGVSKGWGFEFGCFMDIDFDAGNFNDGPNPCQIFYPQDSRFYTTVALLAYLEAYPAVNDYSPALGKELLRRSILTYEHIKVSYPVYALRSTDVGFYGAAMFLLYDYTNETTYLQKAYNARTLVGRTFISDATRGEEFYWEEYIRHKGAILSSGLTYNYDKEDPAELFRNKLYYDFKDAGPKSISNNGERVFQFDTNIQFQNSRYMLVEGLLGTKAMELVPDPEPFIQEIAHSQIAWLTGMNLIQEQVGLNSPVSSKSFIFGIGDYPEEFHSRWLVDSGNLKESGGDIIGSRGTGYKFFDAQSSSYVNFDGVTTILGRSFGGMGNKWRGEAPVPQIRVGKEFSNGLDYIPGWINGAFPSKGDGDTIYNYVDDVNIYEYTETTNEMVAAAIEYFAYLDRDLNGRPRYADVIVDVPVIVPGNQTNQTDPTTPTNQTNQTTPTNQTNQTQNSTNTTSSLRITTRPGQVTIALGDGLRKVSDISGAASFQDITPGMLHINASKTGYNNFSGNVILLPGTNSLLITLTKNGTVIPDSGAKIISDSTTLTATSKNGTTVYPMREDSAATFTVTSDGMNTITWLVDGIAHNTTAAKVANFTWSPGVFWVPKAPDYSNKAVSTITASSATENISWKVEVENVINPFFSGPGGSSDVVGSPSTTVHVLTNDRHVSFTEVHVALLSGAGTAIYRLAKTFNDSTETGWELFIPTLSPGNNFMAQVIGYDNTTGANITYDLGASRAHYVTPPAESRPSTRRSSGGGGGSVLKLFEPDLIYAIFEKGVVAPGETQRLTLDASFFDGGVYSVTAQLLTPIGTIVPLQLALVNGTHDYGTWSTSFRSDFPGEYSLDSIEARDKDNRSGKTFVMGNQTYYSLDTEKEAVEPLGLVYTLLSQSQVWNGTLVDLVLDAMDSRGITEVSASIVSSRGDESVMMLDLVEGEAIYGTWKGSFLVSSPDTTYTVRSVTLWSGDDEKTYDLQGRSVYVMPAPQQAVANMGPGNMLTGASILPFFTGEQLVRTLRDPGTPVVLGFILMLALIGGILLFNYR